MRTGRLLWEAHKKESLNHAQPDQTPALTSGGMVLALTTRCNFTCKHCLRNLGNPQDLPLELAEKAIRGCQKIGYAFFSLTGGEPLLYPHLNNLFELFKETNSCFNIATNGALLNRWQKTLINHKKYLNFIQFSVESCDPKKNDAQRQDGSFKKVLDGFQFCLQNKIPFRIMTAAGKNNIEEIFDIALLAKKKGALALGVTTILPCPRTRENDLVLSSQERELLFTYLKKITKILKFPVLGTAALKTCSQITMCSALNSSELSLDINGNLMQCCDMANFDDQAIHEHAFFASLKDLSFKEALLRVNAGICRVKEDRIKDLFQEDDPARINFNSCFYCLGKIKHKDQNN